MSVILCTAGYDHTIRFWEALSGICSRTLQHPDSQVNRLCITPDKRYLAAAGHTNVKLFDIKSSNPNPVMTFEGHTNNITGVAFHCEGKWMVTSSEDGTVKVWDTRSGSLQRNYVHKAPVNDVVIHPNQGELISGDRAGTVRVWDLGESVCTHQLIPEDDVAVSSVSVASDGSLLCAGNKKGNVYIWRMIQDTEVTRIVPIAMFQAHRDYLTRVLLSPDVKHLATCSADHTAKIWNLDQAYPPAVAAAAAAAETAASRPNNSNGTSTPTPPANGVSNNNGAAGSSSTTQPQQTRSTSTDLAASDFSMVSSAASLNPLLNPNQNQQQQQQSAPFPTQPDGPPIDPSTGTPFLETTLSGHQRWVWDCAFSADSAYLVTVSSDHYARLWELASGTIIRQYSGHHRGAALLSLHGNSYI
uniref:Target of rapamycin complex subunit LST8 n=1 Tax=Talaromyces marneffei PM1 TaxID=1077442 RepID=A0A093VFH8_TALMA